MQTVPSLPASQPAPVRSDKLDGCPDQPARTTFNTVGHPAVESFSALYISLEAPLPCSEARQAERGGQPLILPVIRQGVDFVSGESICSLGKVCAESARACTFSTALKVAAIILMTGHSSVCHRLHRLHARTLI